MHVFHCETAQPPSQALLSGGIVTLLLFHVTTAHNECTCSKMKELVYTYDGLYQVTAATMETGQEGFKICK